MPKNESNSIPLLNSQKPDGENQRNTLHTIRPAIKRLKFLNELHIFIFGAFLVNFSVFYFLISSFVRQIFYSHNFYLLFLCVLVLTVLLLLWSNSKFPNYQSIGRRINIVAYFLSLIITIFLLISFVEISDSLRPLIGTFVVTLFFVVVIIYNPLILVIFALTVPLQIYAIIILLKTPTDKSKEVTFGESQDLDKCIIVINPNWLQSTILINYLHIVLLALSYIAFSLFAAFIAVLVIGFGISSSQTFTLHTYIVSYGSFFVISFFIVLIIFCFFKINKRFAFYKNNIVEKEPTKVLMRNHELKILLILNALIYLLLSFPLLLISVVGFLILPIVSFGPLVFILVLILLQIYAVRGLFSDQGIANEIH